MAEKISVALVGNPNCGKTTLFNMLTGSRQKVGNWAGVTVAKKTGRLTHHQHTIDVVDLPGIYSLSIAKGAGSLDERIACRFLINEQPDLVINIVDAANLKRHLFLTLQLLEMGIPCIIALNMMDMAEKLEMQIDFVALSQKLGCPVIPLISHRGIGIEELKNAVLSYAQFENRKTVLRMEWPLPIQSAVLAMTEARHPQIPEWAAIRLLENDELCKEVFNENTINELIQHHTQLISAQLNEECDLLIAEYRYGQIEKILQSCVNTSRRKSHRLTKIIDNIVINRYLGLPLFLLIMYLMFEISMSIGGLLQPLFDDTSSVLLVEGLNHLCAQLKAPDWLTAVLAQGIGLGINTVLSFVPQIGLLFLILSFLEDSGYMARTAFVMDKVMQSVGLPGKSFIPLIVGFGCNVPAIMATRTLETPRDRILTTLMTPFMSCGARLAIFVVFGSVFFPKHSGLLIFLLYLIGIIAAMLTGLLLKSTVLNGENSPFILELPNYHIPTWKNLGLLTWQRLKEFVWRAGKVIVPICVLLGSINTITIGSQSILSIASKKITPLFTPMGIQTENWPATVGLVTGVLAKEVVVGTLNTLYVQNNASAAQAEEAFHLIPKLQAALSDTVRGLRSFFSLQNINPFTATIADHDMSAAALGHMALAFGGTAAAFSYLLFVLLYMPCVSTIGVITREIGWRWALGSLFWSLSVAYSVAVLFYQIFTWREHAFISLLWVTGIIMFQFIIWLILKNMSERKWITCYL